MTKAYVLCQDIWPEGFSIEGVYASRDIAMMSGEEKFLDDTQSRPDPKRPLLWKAAKSYKNPDGSEDFDDFATGATAAWTLMHGKTYTERYVVECPLIGGSP